MPREKYKQRIGWLFKKKDMVKGQTEILWEKEGIAFWCNKETVKKTSANPMANQYKSGTEEVIKTTTQINFDINDRIAFTPTPTHNANASDFGVIIEIDERPYMERGSKYRTVTYKEFWLRLS